MTRHSIQLAALGCFLVLAGCGDELRSGFSFSDQERYQVLIETEPEPAVPEKPLALVVEVLKLEDTKASLESVSWKAVGPDGVEVNADLKQGDDQAWTSTVIFPVSGDYAYDLIIVDSKGEDGRSGTVAVACPSNSPLGGSCCDASNCANSALCIVATCQEAPNALGEPCLEGVDCVTGECFEFACAPEPTCDDGRMNGDETDSDCGGATCTPCLETQMCVTASDCATNVCEDSVCGPPLGWLIGKGNGSPDSVTLKVVLASGLGRPTDLDFNPDQESQVWITNSATDHLTVIDNPGEDNQQVTHFQDYSRHFLEQIVTISFGNNQTFATCGDSRNSYDNFQAPNDFMGPSLWPSTKAEFFQHGPDAANVHLDMLHSSPFCMGIESYQNGSQYFAFNGYLGVLDFYDFGQPHPDKKYGGEDHMDGKKRRYSNVKLLRVQTVPSHMHFDNESGWLYIADTGNRRILRVNIDSSTKGATLPSFPFDGNLWEYAGEVQESFIGQSGNLLQRPSGVTLHDGILYVTDNQNGNIHAFDSEGNVVRSLETGLGNGALAGITVGPDGRIYLVDMGTNRILRIEP
jgi:DNA-binding beta-propeller fold protein YncE